MEMMVALIVMTMRLPMVVVMVKLLLLLLLLLLSCQVFGFGFGLFVCDRIVHSDGPQYIYIDMEYTIMDIIKQKVGNSSPQAVFL